MNYFKTQYHHHHPRISARHKFTKKLQGHCVSHISQCCCGRWCSPTATPDTDLLATTITTITHYYLVTDMTSWADRQQLMMPLNMKRSLKLRLYSVFTCLRSIHQEGSICDKHQVVALSVECRTYDQEVVGSSLGRARGVKTLGMSFTPMCLCSPSSISWYRPKGGDALRLGSKGRYGSCVGGR